MAKVTLPQLTQQQINRFRERVNVGIADECWEWQGTCTEDGYGRIRFNNQRFLTHRIAYLIEFGFDPKELLVLHHCDNPPCCNPKHFFLGTPLDNAQDREAKGRRVPAKGERHGSRTKPESTLRGEDNARAILSEAQVLEIRYLYATAKTPHRKLARQFGVCKTLITRILNRIAWKHI